MMSASRAKRPRHTMPAFMREALDDNGLYNIYKQRPAYQRNDYIGWISRAALDETKQKRLKQMLMELKKGNIYMNMKWNSKKAT
jgi:uncharacterized protein YdeI (YjbR/CyaY-like superfamily)